MFCTSGTGKSSSSKPSRRSQDGSSKPAVPLLLHFDVNKTVIQSDSVQMKGVEEGIREGIADLFWGNVSKNGGSETWEWIKAEPTCTPPKDDILAVGTTPLNYTQWCKRTVKDKKEMKAAVRSFSLVAGQPVEKEMQKLLQVTIKKMQLRPEVRKSKEAEGAGLLGPTFNMFPALFHMVVKLQKERRPFAILFRSFGADHEKIQQEWNAFCELRHPIFSPLIEDIGPMDGSVPGVPDRRIHSIHTLYRDAHGPLLLLDTFTNGPDESPWDEWARTKPKPTVDSRNGKSWSKQALKAKVVEGMSGFRKFSSDHLAKQATAAIKDDWAWWQFQSEKAAGGKLMTLLKKKDSAQVFFDDNIEPFDARIVDCRDEYGNPVPDGQALDRYLVKVNPVEAMLDDQYFFRKLLYTQGEKTDVGASLMGVQKQLAEKEEENSLLEKQLTNMGQQLKHLMEENRRMKQQRRITVRDENELQSILQKDGVDVKAFGTGRFKSIANLYQEMEQGACWLQMNDAGRIVRVLDVVYLLIKFNDMLLVESYEQDGVNNRIQTKNHIPGVHMYLKDTSMQDVLDRWFQNGLQVDISKFIETEEMPVYMTDTPPQVSLLTEAYPVPCLVQQSQGTFNIPDKDVELYKELFSKIGLPGGKPFFTTLKDPVDNTSITRFWRWERLKTWKANATTSGKKGATQIQDVSVTCAKLFKDHPRAEIYQRLLLQMFEVFEAQKLTGGFSGSLVIRVQPFEADGRPGEPCIVKLDEGKAIRTEASNSENVFKALPDRAARILGDAVYGRDKEKNEEFGAMRLELAGACWNVPELAQGSSNLLSTFKDLLLYESEQMLLGSAVLVGSDDLRPFGNVNSVLAETFGPGGIVSSLRKGGNGLHRNIDKPLVSGWYTLKGKESKYNLFHAKKGEYPPEQAMRRLYREYFGGEPPNLKELVVGIIKPRLEELAKMDTGDNLCPLVGLAHGDLNAANIMIDALDAVWLIDFATSVELPLFTDMCKFEMACLFEYATIPITPKLLVEFASTQESAWSELNVGDWLRVDQKTAEILLNLLVALPKDRLEGLSQNDLEKLIDEVVSKSGKAPRKQKAMHRALSARLVADPSLMEAAFAYCNNISSALLAKDYIKDSLEIRGVPLPEGRGARGATSLRFFMEICASIRRFMCNDILTVLREQSNKGQLALADTLSLQLWLPFLRESYRIIGYRDVAPQYKVWCIKHCQLVAQKVQTILEAIQKNIRNLGKLPMMASVKLDIEGSRGMDKAPTRRSDRYSNERAMQLTSHWVRNFSSLFKTYSPAMRAIRKVHRACSRFKDEPGFFAPVFQAQQVGGDKLCRLSFKDLSEKGNNEAWELWLLDAKSLGNNGYTQNVKLGWVVGGKAEPEVILLSRLIPLTDVFLRRKLEDLKEANNPETKEILGTFVLQKWLDLGDEDVRAQHGRGRPTQVGSREDVDGFLCLSVVVKDRAGADLMPLELVVGAPCHCYPPGSMICVDVTAEVPNWAQRSPAVVVQSLTENASAYVVRGAQPLVNEKGDGFAEFEPLPSNHTYLVPLKYQSGKQILFKQSGGEATWSEGQITQVPSTENHYCHVVKVLNGEDKDKEMPLHLDGMNSGIRVANVTASAYEEEVHKIKAFFRARHSFILDSLSGSRFSVKECAPPTLSTVAFSSSKPEGSMTSSMSITKLMRRSASVVSNTVTQTSSTTASELMSNAEVKTGWQTVLNAVENYNLGQPSCGPNAFLVLGSPGSGKSCFVGRLMMEMLDRYENLIPLMLPVADLVKRSDPEGPDAFDADAVQDWFDNYLRLTYGEDSLRYSMIGQAISMSRVVFLFEGLEDAERLTKAVESLIRVLVRSKNLVVVTSRPLLSGRSALESDPELILTMRLESLSDEQKRMVAYARLGAEGIEAYDKLLARLRSSQNVSDQGEEAASDGAEDVFGNPMMLSMLLCYLQTMAKKYAEKKETEGEEYAAEAKEEETTLTAVYRVAVDVMLQRVQARTQSDRWLLQERVDQSKQILQIMAMAMQTSRRAELRVEEVDGLLKQELKSGWEALKSAVSAGHAMFLRMSGESGKEELRFLVKGFQNFFAASCVAAEGAENLPELKELLTDNWWQQMLEMLGEAWPLNYVEIVQNRLGAFKSTSKDNFLHIAARSGHRPIFQLLHRFSESHKVALNQRGEDGMLPLHLAAQTGHTPLIDLMLKAGSAINAEDTGERLAVHIAMRNGHFQTAAFLNERWLEQYGSAKTYERRSRKAEQLAQQMQMGLSEKDFLATANETFTELGFFSAKETVDKKRTVGALLAVFWIVASQYDQFVRGQAEGVRLSKSSWDHLQDWTRNTVCLTKSHSMVSAMLVYVAIMNVGKIKPFRAAFAPEEDEPAEALARILHRSPMLVPSFAKLEPEQQHVILSALKADFNFGQFLQAENLPASLFTVRQILAEGGAASGDILGFFLFRIFAAMSGILGPKSLEGSIFMTETNYKNFEVGLDTLQHLMEDGAVRVYDRFLVARAKGQGLHFQIDGQRDQRALVRLACMMRAFDTKAGAEVAAAWRRLAEPRRNRLVDFLNADGIKITPGFLLYNAPAFLDSAKQNPGQFPLEMTFEVLLQVYERAAKEYEGSDQKVITIMVDELASYAKTCTDVEVFQFVKFEIARTPGQKGDVMGNLIISPWQLQNDKSKLDDLENDAGQLFMELTPQTGLKENLYLKQLQQQFPELGFFRDTDEPTKALLRQTLARLLAVYWTATDQPEAFTRGQDIERKLSDNSWSKIRELTQNSLESGEVFNAVWTVMAVMDVARLPKFRVQLAPDCSTPTQVLNHVLSNSPKVLPSFVRMPQEAQALARDCLVSEFIFAEFIWAEIPPASVTAVKRMLSDSRAGLTSKTKYLGVFLYCVFVEMSASLGSQSLEGSLYMTEDKWQEFEVGKNAILQLEKESEQVVYDSILARSAKRAGIPFDPKVPESCALARIACMCNAMDAEQGQALSKAFDAMEEESKYALSRFLAADGIHQKPAFAFQNARNFLQKAIENREVGPLAAMLVLRKVCEGVKDKFQHQGRAVLTVRLSRLAQFAEEFKGSVTFRDLPFELESAGEGAALVIPKVWIPVRNEDILKTLTSQCRQLAGSVLGFPSIGERRFKTTLARHFPELAYFGPAHQRQLQQTYGALLSVYWLVNDQHEAFTREQDQADMLSKQSWAWIQEWMSEHVKIHSEEVLDSTMVFMAIHALGKITQFREELAPGFSSDLHDVALAHILETQPELVPSFQRLPPKYKTLIMDSLSVDFQFSQFLQAEIVPSNLVVVKEKLKNHGEEGYSIFCFRIFAQMSGKLGDKSLHGSLFMTESQFQRFRPGLEALMQLRTMEAGPAYNAFLLLRGSKALSRFASGQHQALVRLLCLSTAYVHESGEAVCDAFDELKHSERVALTRWLTADGIKERPGYVLREAPELFQNAQANPAVGVLEALKALVRVQEMVQAADAYLLPNFAVSGPVKAYVHLGELAILAREAGPSSQDFAQAELKVTTEDHGDQRIYKVEVIREEGLDAFYTDDEMRSSCCARCCSRLSRCVLMLLLLILFVVPGAAAAGIYFYPEKANKLLEKIPTEGRLSFLQKPIDLVEDHPRMSMYVLAAVSALSLLGILASCCCRSNSQRPLMYDSIQERVWCCAARTTSRMGNGPRDDGSGACCAYQPLLQVESGAGEPILPKAAAHMS